jgi:hypothetical protein
VRTGGLGRGVAAAALLLSVAVAGCGGVARKSSAPATGSSGWTELRTPHFTINTDLDRATAEQAAVDFESMFSTLSDVAFRSGELPRVNIDVIHFRRAEDYELTAPKNAAAYFGSGTSYDFEFRSIVVLFGDLTNFTRATIQHELTHFFVRHYYPQAPPWLSEGMAGYYESVVLEGGVTILGRRKRLAFHRGPWQSSCREEGCLTLLPAPSAQTVKELLALTAQDFLGSNWTDDNTVANREAYLANITRRASAISLVALLLHHPRYRPAFDDYLARIRRGERSELAWADSLGKLAAEKLEVDFRTSVFDREIPLLRIEYSPPRRPPEGVRELSWPEVHLLRAGLWDWGDDKGRAAAGAELDRIEPGFRSVPKFLMMKAAWLEAGKRATEARVLLESALKAHPDDPRLLNAMGYALLGTVEGKAATADAEAALQKVADQLAPLARTAAQDHLIAKARARKGALALAMAHEKRAISRDPNCIQCLASLAELFDRRGLVADALAAALLADGLLLEGKRPPELSEQIQRYRAKLAGGPSARPGKN